MLRNTEVSQAVRGLSLVDPCRQNKLVNARMKVFPMQVEDFLLQARCNPRAKDLGVPTPGSLFCLTACPPW